ncbi:hypothetical protein AS9A_1763 [Hoyosella subflava DQS3-9A1]|uniref:DUF7455 domain-containing protein n=2 Tax=Hoyosella TaxID=697025 RepID=F6ELG2_HOYSD|nr:hypothetical protein AS9A_1763 [Hoyosella subflava DQS3-9A1]
MATLPSGGELLFCNHHANEFQPKLTELEAIVAVAADDD